MLERGGVVVGGVLNMRLVLLRDVGSELDR